MLGQENLASTSPSPNGHTPKQQVLEKEQEIIQPDVPHDEKLRDSIVSFADTHKSLDDKLYQYQLSKILAHVECTETGNAIRFAARYGSRFHWVAKWKIWLYWNEYIWVEDEKGLIMKYAKQVAAHLDLESKIVPLPTDEHGELLIFPHLARGEKPTPNQQEVIAQFKDRDIKVAALNKWAMQSRARRSLEAMIELLKDEPGIAVLPDELDNYPHYVACKNGVLDLHTRELLPFDRTRLITKSVNVAYNPLALCPKWDKFFLTAMSNSQSMVEFIQQLLGIGLTAEALEDILGIFYGSGGNGKSVFVEIIKQILGTYAATANSDLFVDKQSEGISNDIARLVNIRTLVASETKEGRHLDESLVKSLTGGDKKTARFLHKEYFEFYPRFTPILLTNYKPIIKGTDNGIWRRVKLVPWLHNFEESPERKDKQAVLTELAEENEGIFAWMVRGYAMRHQAGKLVLPTEVVEATNQYRRDSDLIGQFLEACCVIDGTRNKVFHSAIYSAYKQHCMENGNNPVASNKLSQKLKERGIEGGTSGGKAYWYGLRLKTEDELTRDFEDSLTDTSNNGILQGETQVQIIPLRSDISPNQQNGHGSNIPQEARALFTDYIEDLKKKKNDVMWVASDCGYPNEMLSVADHYKKSKELYLSGDENKRKAALEAIHRTLGRYEGGHAF